MAKPVIDYLALQEILYDLVNELPSAIALAETWIMDNDEKYVPEWIVHLAGGNFNNWDELKKEVLELMAQKDSLTQYIQEHFEKVTSKKILPNLKDYLEEL